MQNNRLPAHAEGPQLPEGLLDITPAPPAAAPPSEVPSADKQLPTELFDTADTAVDTQPVIKPDLSPVEWVMSTLWNVPGSAAQNVGDTLSLLRPWGERAGGKRTPIPGILDLARLVSEAGFRSAEWNRQAMNSPMGVGTLLRGYTELDEQLFGGAPQEGNAAPLFEAFAQYITGRYDFTKPEVRAAFSEVVRTDPVGVMTDIMTVPSIAAGGGAAGVRAAAVATKTTSRMGRILRTASRGADWANRVVNRGFHVPLVPAKIVPRQFQSRLSAGQLPGQRFEVRSGIADIADPGVWALRGIGRGAGRLAEGVRIPSGFSPRTPEDAAAQTAQQDRLVRQGFTDAPSPEDALLAVVRGDQSAQNVVPQEAGIFTPLSLVSESESLLRAEARRYDRNFTPIIDAVERTETQFNDRVGEILNTAHADGNLERAAYELSQAYQVSRQTLIDGVDMLMREAGAEPGLVVDMRPVHTLLQDLKAQDEALARLGTGIDDDYVPFADDPEIRKIDEHVTALESQNQNMLTADFLSGQPARAPTTPVVRSETASAPKVEDELYGTPTRQSLDTNTGQTYATTYRIMDLPDIITSHNVSTQGDLIATPNDAFDSALQVKDMSLPAQMQKVWDIARHLFPDELLGGNRTIQAGTPILDSRRMTISGNHRVAALRVALRAFPEKAQAYRDRIPAEMERFGLTDDISQMEFPVLVRVLDDDVDLQQFARAGNVAEQSMLGETAQATQDLHVIDDDLLTLFDAGDGQTAMADVVRSDANTDFRQRFIGKLSSSEQAQFVSKGKELSKRGEARITNALTAKVFDGQFGAALRGIFTEGASAGFRNIQRGIQNALPAMLQLRELDPNFNIAEPMAEAILKLEDFRENQKTGKGVQAAINTYLDNTSEGGLFGALDETDTSWQIRDLDEKGRTLLRVLAVGVDKRTMLTNFIREYAETVRQSSADVPAEEVLDTIASKYIDAYEKGVSDELKQGLNALFQYADEADADAAAARAAQPAPDAPPPTEAPRVVEPVLLENLIAYRDALRKTLQSKSVGPRLKQWRTQLLQSLDTAIYDTLAAAGTENTSAINVARYADYTTTENLNSSFAKLMEDLLDGSRNPRDPAVQRAIETVFTANDTPMSVREKYELMGGPNSDAARRVRRIFLAKMFDFIRTDAGQADAAAVARGEQPVGDLTQRYNAEGIRKYLNQFMISATDYDDKTLRAILGDQTVDDLHDLDGILQAFGRFMKRTGKDEKFFGVQVRSDLMSRVLNNLGGKLLGVGGGYAAYQGAGGGIAGALGGAAVGFVLQWLPRAAGNVIFNQLYSHSTGRQALLEGLEVALQGAWGDGARVLERGTQGAAVRQAARTARTASKREEE